MNERRDDGGGGRGAAGIQPEQRRDPRMLQARKRMSELGGRERGERENTLIFKSEGFG